MTFSCDQCHQTFATELALELHRDGCSEALFCRECGERFGEAEATTDGWHYRCPNPDCEGEEIGEDLVYVQDARILAK